MVHAPITHALGGSCNSAVVVFNKSSSLPWIAFLLVTQTLQT